MTAPSRITEELTAALGALLGAALGYYTFQWLYHRGFYGMMIPGALLGLGCSLASRRPSHARGVACAAAAFALALFVEWKFFPFRDDPSFRHFLTRLPDLKGVTILMIAAGAGFAYWLGRDAGGDRFRRAAPGAE
ncbi:hypothetical protein [Planctomyces sp. SH-PL62]|uniref:hypothetical protein n=1 Tax=Planctomyces sp. SH-PL62 TaxID=1636152 RepID=UPI00078C0009|nr:hypothetical protein [Planctomyces sp. SH-PL62]AMV38080.1 hypothetical protein VT85_11625 [Planctomyces sp. SH-PL62]